MVQSAVIILKMVILGKVKIAGNSYHIGYRRGDYDIEVISGFSVINRDTL